MTFSLNIIPSGGSASASNLIIDNKSVADEETYTCPEVIGQYLESGDSISTIAGAATSLTLRISGREIT